MRPKKPNNRGWWLAALLLGSIALSIGCNPLTAAYFIFVQNPNFPPDKFSFTKKKRNPKVVILACHASAQTQANTDLLHADQLLAQRLTQTLTKGYRDNRQKIEFVPVYQVKKFKTDNPNWKLMGLEEVGKHFEADYVLNLEIIRLSLYEERSNQQLFRGNAELQVTVVDVNDPAEGMVVSEPYLCTYPGSGPVPVDRSPSAFRTQFINKMARDLTCWFASYPTESKQDFD